MFSITCTTCQARLKVRNRAAIGQILACPKCDAMVEVVPPPDWQAQGPPGPAATSSPPNDQAIVAADAIATVAPDDEAVDRPSLSAIGQFCRGWAAWGVPASLGLLVVGGLFATALIRSSQAPPNRTGASDSDSSVPQPAHESAVGGAEVTLPPPAVPPAHDQHSPHREVMAEPTTADNSPGSVVTPAAAAPPGPGETAAGPTSETPQPAVVSPPAGGGHAAPNSTPPVLATTGLRQDRRTGTTGAVHGSDQPRHVSQPVDAQARLADAIRQVDFHAIQLIDLIDLLVQLTRVPITLDLNALERAGIQVTDPVSIHRQDTTVAQLLADALQEFDLTYSVDDGQVTVTRPGPVWTAVLYRVDDLLPTGSAADPPAALAEFTRRIQQLVAPATWQTAGGRGSVRLQDGALQIEQSPDIHYHILVLCEKLRVARGLPPRSRLPAARFTLSSRRAQIRHQLDRRVTFTFVDPTPILQWTRHLRKATGLALAIDWRLLTAMGFDPDLQITGAVIDRPLGEALTEVLEPIGLAWRAADSKTVQIVTHAEAQRRLELELYAVARRANTPFDPKHWPDKLRASVDKGSWAGSGGAGVVVYDELGSHLIVLQTQSLQERTERWLKEWEAASPDGQ